LQGTSTLHFREGKDIEIEEDLAKLKMLIEKVFSNRTRRSTVSGET